MLQNQRHRKMLEYLADHECLTVEEAVGRFDASPATVRRDFNDLAETGLIERLRGGIRRSSGSSDNVLPFTLRAKWYSDEKRRLAERAVTLIPPDSVVFIDGGSTTSHLGMSLPEHALTVITNSLPLSTMLGARFPAGGGPEVYLSGGGLHLKSGLLLGPNAEASMAQYRADLAILSVRGIDGTGLYNNNELIAGIEKVMIRNADRVMVLADHSKIGKVSMCRVCGLEEIDLLITTAARENRDVLDAVRSAGVEVLELEPAD